MRAPGTLAPGTRHLRDKYALWAPTYQAIAHNPVMRLEEAIVGPILERLGATRALDVGTGTGRYLPVLARTGASTVVGIDLSTPMLGRAMAGLKSGATDTRGTARRLVCADAASLPFRARSFDVINASLMVGDIDDLRAWSRELAGALVRGGHLVYSDFHPTWTEYGWKRTFSAADGSIHDLGFIPHTIEAHVAALEAAGFRVAAIREPRFTDDAEAGVRAFRRRWGNPPVLVIFHAIRET